MSSISIRWERRAVKELAALPRDDQQQVFDRVEALIDNPLKGKPLSGQWKGFRRVRAGTYRVVYAFDGARLLILVLRVGHRRDVYR